MGPRLKWEAVMRTERREKLMPALRPRVAKTARSWPALASGSMSPARWALAEEFGEGGAGELFLLGSQGERLGERNLAGELAGETFGVVAVRGKNQHRTEALAEGAGDPA
jgi:hypothetical protein